MRALPDKDTPQTLLAQRLIELRLTRRFTRAKLAEQAGVSVVYLKLLERGVNPATKQPVEPTPRMLQKIADALAEGDEDLATHYFLLLSEAAGTLPSRAKVLQWMEKQRPDISDAGLFQAEISLRILKKVRELPAEKQLVVLQLVEML